VYITAMSKAQYMRHRRKVIKGVRDFILSIDSDDDSSAVAAEPIVMTVTHCTDVDESAQCQCTGTVETSDFEMEYEKARLSDSDESEASTVLSAYVTQSGLTVVLVLKWLLRKAHFAVI
jgi:hypothetical protein